MRNAITAAVCIAASFSAAAEEGKCEQIGKLAEVVMENRQSGVPMMKSMQAAGDDRLVKDLIVWAYKLPGYSTEQYKKRAVVNFQNEVYLMCLEKQAKI